MKRNKDKWVYWKKGDTIRIVLNRKVLYTLPKNPEILYNIINATQNKPINATNPTQENNINNGERFAYDTLSEPQNNPINAENMHKLTQEALNKLMDFNNKPQNKQELTQEQKDLIKKLCE